MSAKTGKPVNYGVDIATGKRTWELQDAVHGSLLAVCPACGFEFDASHTVCEVVADPSHKLTHEQRATEGYECPRCTLRHFLATRQRVIEETVARGAAQLAASVRVEVLRLRTCALAALQLVVVHRDGRDLGGVWRVMEEALALAGFPLDGVNVTAPPPPMRVAGALALLRESFRNRNDGAEGESVHVVCDELERLLMSGQRIDSATSAQRPSDAKGERCEEVHPGEGGRCIYGSGHPIDYHTDGSIRWPVRWPPAEPAACSTCGVRKALAHCAACFADERALAVRALEDRDALHLADVPTVSARTARIRALQQAKDGPAPTFEEAWAKMEAQGFQYGRDALEQVRFGWEIRDAYDAQRVDKASPDEDLKTLRAALQELENYRDDCESYEAPEGVDHLANVIVRLQALIGRHSDYPSPITLEMLSSLLLEDASASTDPAAIFAYRAAANRVRTIINAQRIDSATSGPCTPDDTGRRCAVHHMPLYPAGYCAWRP